MKRIEKFTQQSASCLLTIDGSRAKLTHVYSKTRHQGHATALLTGVTKYADENELELFLTVQAYGQPVSTILSNDELVNFYSQFGFGVLGNHVASTRVTMWRPRRKNTPYNEREN